MNKRKLIAKETRRLSNGTTYLTKGKIYKILKEEGKTYRVIDDIGREYGYWKWRFETLSCVACISRKCNSCPINKESK